MKKVLRSTTFGPPPTYTSFTVVVEQSSLRFPAEEVGEPAEGVAFTVNDIFEVEDDWDLESCTLMGVDRALWRAEDERNMAIMYHYYVSVFGTLKDGGVIISDKPMPLTEEQILYVWGQLVKISEYRNFGFYAFTSEGVPVTRNNRLES